MLVETLQGNLHQYVVSARFDAASFAIFSVALLQIPLVDYTATAASSVVMVRMGDALHAGRPGEVKALWHDVVSKLALVFVPLVALLLVTGDELIVLLFTDRYAASVPLFKLASLGILLSMLQTDSVLRTLAQTRLLLELSLVRLGLIAIAIVPALTRFGFAGAIGVTLVSGFTVKTLALVSIGRRQQIPFGDLLPWRSLGLMAILSAAAGLCAFVMRAAIAGPLVLRLLATGAVFAGVYLVLACWSGLVPPAAVRGIRGWLRGAASMN